MAIGTASVLFALALGTLTMLGCVPAPPPNAASISAGEGKTAEWLDTATPVQWLLQKDFERLDRLLDALYEEVKARPENEYRLMWTYFALEDSYRETRQNVAAWRAERPQSQNARILEGAQAIQEAWAIRGSGVASSVSRENFSRFHAGLERVAEILSPALDAVPDHPTAWNYYVTSQCAHKTGSCPEAIAAMLDENVPHAYFARRRLMNFIQPKWSGSMEMLQAYQRKLEAEMAGNPHWKPLLGFDQLVLCEVYGRQKHFDSSLAACEKAWSFGPDSLYLESIAPTYIGLKRFKQLGEHVRELQTRFPSDAYEDKLKKIAQRMAIRGRDVARTGDTVSAMEAFAVAIEIAPQEPMAYIERAYLYKQRRNFDEAEKDLRLAISADPDYRESYDRLTDVIMWRRTDTYKRYRDSDADLIPLWLGYLERHPDDALAHYQLAQHYHHFNHDAEASRRHLELSCKNGYDGACQ